MLGEDVAVLRRTQTGTDAMGEPTYEWVPEVVGCCLVRPLDGSDAIAADAPDGRRCEYRIAFPKAWTATAAPLAGCRVALVSRGMDAADAARALRVSGSPDRTVPCPTRWDTVADVWRADG